MKKCLYCDGSGVQDNLGWDLPKSCQPCCVHCDGEGYVSNLKYVYHKVRDYLWLSIGWRIRRVT